MLNLKHVKFKNKGVINEDEYTLIKKDDLIYMIHKKQRLNTLVNNLLKPIRRAKKGVSSTDEIIIPLSNYMAFAKRNGLHTISANILPINIDDISFDFTNSDDDNMDNYYIKIKNLGHINMSYCENNEWVKGYSTNLFKKAN